MCLNIPSGRERGFATKPKGWSFRQALRSCADVNRVHLSKINFNCNFFDICSLTCFNIMPHPLLISVATKVLYVHLCQTLLRNARHLLHSAGPKCSASEASDQPPQGEALCSVNMHCRNMDSKIHPLSFTRFNLPLRPSVVVLCCVLCQVIPWASCSMQTLKGLKPCLSNISHKPSAQRDSSPSKFWLDLQPAPVFLSLTQHGLNTIVNFVTRSSSCFIGVSDHSKFPVSLVDFQLISGVDRSTSTSRRPLLLDPTLLWRCNLISRYFQTQH